MGLFFELEIVYIVIGLFILAVAAIVTTRSFVPRVAFKRSMISITMFMSFMIGFHYYVTTARMAGVKEIFNAGETVVCENKMQRTISRSVLISKDFEWRLEGNEFVSDNYERNFHTARCVDYAPIDPKTIGMEKK